tara:strand:+ start:270 stop:578 length:309 start_codon:yes stop_codon:yes gene_type:complete
MPRGQTPKQRRFRKETKPGRTALRKAKDVLTRMSLVKDPDELAGMNNLRDNISNTMERFLTPVAGAGISGAAGNVLKKLKPMKKEMSTGGEVDIDMTTEMDV